MESFWRARGVEIGPFPFRGKLEMSELEMSRLEMSELEMSPLYPSLAEIFEPIDSRKLASAIDGCWHWALHPTALDPRTNLLRLLMGSGIQGVGDPPLIGSQNRL